MTDPADIKVTAGVSDLSEDEFVKDVKEKAKAQTDYPTIVPTLDPTATAVSAKVTAMETKISDRASLQDQVKQATTDINALWKEINGNMVNDWAPQIQKAVAGDVGKVQLLHFYVKNIDDGHAPDETSVNNSCPVIESIDASHKGQHTIHYVNSVTGKTKLPFDAKHVEVYMCFSDTEPGNDLKKWSYCGAAVKGKFTVHFSDDELGKNVWYVLVYAAKKPSGAGLELSGKVKRTAS